MNLRKNVTANAGGFSLFIYYIFAGTRLRLKQYFEILLPSRIIDQREYDFKHCGNALAQLPPLIPTSENLLMWNKGRRAIFKYGIFYRRRVEAFMAIYIITLVLLSVYQVIVFVVFPDVIIAKSSGSIVFPESAVIILFLNINFICLFLIMIYSGIRLNRTIKLQAASIRTFIVCAKEDLIKQIKDIEKDPNKDKNEKQNLIKTLKGEANEFHKTVRAIENEMEADEMTQKAKILGVTVDVTMLEFIVAIGSSTAYVLYDTLWSQSSNRGM